MLPEHHRAPAPVGDGQRGRPGRFRRPGRRLRGGLRSLQHVALWTRARRTAGGSGTSVTSASARPASRCRPPAWTGEGTSRWGSAPTSSRGGSSPVPGTHQLHDFAGGTNAYVRAINADGLMVGEALDADGNDFAAMWPHWWSRPIRLAPVPGYDGSYAQGVNDRGQVTGGSYSFGSLPTVATRWSPARRPGGRCRHRRTRRP